jgi:hypothetical protein
VEEVEVAIGAQNLRQEHGALFNSGGHVGAVDQQSTGVREWNSERYCWQSVFLDEFGKVDAQGVCPRRWQNDHSLRMPAESGRRLVDVLRCAHLHNLQLEAKLGRNVANRVQGDST